MTKCPNGCCNCIECEGGATCPICGFEVNKIEKNIHCSLNDRLREMLER